MSRKDKIKQLFKSTVSSDNPYFRIKLVLVILVLMVIIEVIFSVAWLNNLSAQNKHLIADHAQTLSQLQDHLAWQKIVRVYNDNLPITITKNRNTGDSIKLSGYIKNTGTREIGTITLTAMCLDSRSFPVCEQIIPVKSSDDQPLKQYQRRRFNITIDNPPDTAKGVQVIVSDIEFKN